MTGTILNAGAVLAGSALGLALGAKVPEKVRDTLMDGIGLVVLLLGMQMALQTRNSLVVLGAVLIGGAIGELLDIEGRLGRLGDTIKGRVGSAAPRFTEGFVAASVLFCIGPMAILGSVNDGLRGDYSVLAVKSVLDGVSALAFSSTMGLGVPFSVLPMLVYQGGLTLLAGAAQSLLSDAMVTEMTATGGVIILGIGIRLLHLRQIRVANFVPALVLAPVLALLL
ncbi:MAG: DUF554 domain-containing protein [Anaerolineae bacterium]